MCAWPGSGESYRVQLRDWRLSLKNLLFPIFCKACSERLLNDENGYFCPRCWESSPRVERPFCPHCGRPHEAAVGLGLRSNFLCAECREKPNPQIRRIFAPALFDGAVAEAIKLFKFGHRVRLAGPLGRLMTEYATQEMQAEAYDLATPVPLHQVRERSRGYNQSRLLAVEALRAFPGMRLEESLWRIRPTRMQSTLASAERKANIRGAFAVEGDAFQGKRVLLVDDVVTTGGTVTECARMLRRAGAKDVDVLAVAVTARHYMAPTA